MKKNWQQTALMLIFCLSFMYTFSKPIEAYVNTNQPSQLMEKPLPYQGPSIHHMPSDHRLSTVQNRNLSAHYPLQHKLQPMTNQSWSIWPNRQMPSFKQGNSVEQSAASQQPPSTIDYVIQSGDTLYRIAQFFDTTVEALTFENVIDDPTTLRIGQQLKIPTKTDHASELASHPNVVQTLQATLTAYTAGYESTGKTPSHPEYGVTSSGAKVQENYTIAVDPTIIPMGSLVYIDGIGIRKAQDTGSAIKGNKIDVYIPDLEEALTFGVKEDIKVYVLDSEQNSVRVASATP